MAARALLTGLKMVFVPEVVIAKYFVKKMADEESVIANTVRRFCSFYNDTEYHVTVIRHDGSFELVPEDEIAQWIVRGFAIDLVIKFPTGKTEKIEFPSSRFENRVHKISEVFYENITAFQAEQEKKFAAKSPSTQLTSTATPTLAMFTHTSKPICKATDRLDLNRHFKWVKLAAWDARAKWEHLAIQLGLGVGTRDAIKKSHPGNVDTCYDEMMVKWLQQSHPSPTWAALLDALESTVIDRHDLVVEIKKWLTSKKIKFDDASDFE